jgi:hypothetical protein
LVVVESEEKEKKFERLEKVELNFFCFRFFLFEEPSFCSSPSSLSVSLSALLILPLSEIEMRQAHHLRTLSTSAGAAGTGSQPRGSGTAILRQRQRRPSSASSGGIRHRTIDPSFPPRPPHSLPPQEAVTAAGEQARTLISPDRSNCDSER